MPGPGGSGVGYGRGVHPAERPRHGIHTPGPAHRLTVLGSMNMDLTATTPRLPAPGETILGTDFATSQGGKGANQAIAAARAGADVVMIGAVGADDFGDRLVAALLANGVRTELVRRVEGPSGIAMITVDRAAENTIVVAPGANGQLVGLTSADLAAIAGSALFVLQLEVPIDTVTAAALAAAAAGVPVLLNPSPVRPLPAELLAAVSVIIVNEREERSLGVAVLDQVPHVVTTLGAAGARYRGPAGSVSTPSPAVAPVDSTGAGDAFTGAFALAWIESADPGAALTRACAAGAIATTRPGAGESAPTRAEIDSAISRAATDAEPLC